MAWLRGLRPIDNSGTSVAVAVPDETQTGDLVIAVVMGTNNGSGSCRPWSHDGSWAVDGGDFGSTLSGRFDGHYYFDDAPATPSDLNMTITATNERDGIGGFVAAIADANVTASAMDGAIRYFYDTGDSIDTSPGSDTTVNNIFVLGCLYTKSTTQTPILNDPFYTPLYSKFRGSGGANLPIYGYIPAAGALPSINANAGVPDGTNINIGGWMLCIKEADTGNPVPPPIYTDPGTGETHSEILLQPVYSAWKDFNENHPSASPTRPWLDKDNQAYGVTTPDTTLSFTGSSTGSGGDVDTANSRITWTSHPIVSGEPAAYEYDQNGAGTAVMTDGRRVTLKYYDANTVEVYGAGENNLFTTLETLTADGAAGTHKLHSLNFAGIAQDYRETYYNTTVMAKRALPYIQHSDGVERHAANVIVGRVHDLGSARDMRTEFLITRYIVTQRNDVYKNTADHGMVLGLSDKDGNCRWYDIGGQDYFLGMGEQDVYCIIDPSDGDGRAVGEDAGFDEQYVRGILFGSVYNSKADDGSNNINYLTYWDNWLIPGTYPILGGTSGNPLDGDALGNYLLDGEGMNLNAGDGQQITTPFDIVFGNNSDDIYVDVENHSLHQKTVYDTTGTKVFDHRPADSIGINYKASAGSTVKHRNSIVSSDRSTTWQVDSSASSSATYDFSGLTVINRTVTLRAFVDYNLLTFVGCSQIDLDGQTVTNTTFKNPRSGTTLTKIDTLGVTLTGNNTYSTDTAADNLLEIANGTSTGTVTIENHDFTGATKCILVSGTSGTVTINVGAGVTGLVDSSDVSAPNGASVVVSNADSWDLKLTDGTNFPNGTRYRIVDSVDGQIYNTTISGGTGFNFADTTLTAGRTLTLTTAYVNGTDVRLGGPWVATVPTGGGDIDWTGNVPDTISEAVTWGISSAHADFSIDYTSDPFFEVDSLSTQISRKEFFYFMLSVQATSDGIANLHKCLIVEDATSVVFDTDTFSNFIMENVNYTTANRNIEWTDTGFHFNMKDDSNPLGNGQTMFNASPKQIATSSGSGLTSEQNTTLNNIASNVTTVDTVVDAVKAKTDDLTFTVSGKVDANITHVNEIEITGDGQDSTPFNPV